MKCLTGLVEFVSVGYIAGLINKYRILVYNEHLLQEENTNLKNQIEELKKQLISEYYGYLLNFRGFHFIILFVISIIH